MRKQLTDLRAVMAREGIDAYFIPTTDFHGSEYVNDYFKCRKYISGFTGSAGTLVVTADEAKLWTDGRYFLQAGKELAGSGIGLMKMGQPGVPEIPDYLAETIKKGSCLGFDGRVIDCALGRQMEERLSAKDITIRYDLDLAGEIWTERPALTATKVYSISEEVTGESSASKLTKLRKAMAQKGADYHLITKLEEIAWLYNLRGSDVANTPVFYAFALISADTARLYVLDQAFDGLQTLPYFQIFEDLKALKPGTLLLDETVVSYTLVKSLPAHVRVINTANPADLMKALKNPIEIESTKKAHLRDGAAMVNFIYWLKKNIGKMPMTEISAADYLENCRRGQKGFKDLSFDTISGYGPNGAIVHYSATEASNLPLKPESFLLVDSGGQYEDGTTDITRTIALGPLCQQMKTHYTLVLKSHIQLALTEFTAGTTGADLDKIARKPLHDAGLDFNHGTGHGVGHLLSVHEGPQNISPRGTKQIFLPGMITSNEPGLYFEGQYGIRLENEILCTELPSGKLAFETITFCPLDREAILPEMLAEEELAWLNRYHKQVYENIGPLVSPETADWLKEVTAPITKE